MQQNSSSIRDQEKLLIEKIGNLSPEKLSEVEDFVDVIRDRDQNRALLYAGNKLAESAFGRIWDNPEDEIYDRLQLREYYGRT